MHAEECLCNCHKNENDKMNFHMLKDNLSKICKSIFLFVIKLCESMKSLKNFFAIVACNTEKKMSTFWQKNSLFSHKKLD